MSEPNRETGEPVLHSPELQEHFLITCPLPQASGGSDLGISQPEEGIVGQLLRQHHWDLCMCVCVCVCVCACVCVCVCL